MWRHKIMAAALATLFAFPAAGQTSIQTLSGHIIGNSTASQRPARDETVSAILDRALGSTRGSVIERAAAGWGIVVPSSTAGLAWISNGTGADPGYGILPLAGGGCNAALTASAGGILYSTAGACAILTGTANAGRPLLSGSAAAPSWAAFSLPGSVTSGGVPYFSSTSAMGSSALLTLNQVIVGGGAGNPPTSFAGTSGGAAYFGAGGILQTTAALTSGQVLRGGGAGAGPATFAGTSGGIPYFDASNLLQTSGLLTANGVVLGGGAGTSPGVTAAGATNTLLHGNTGAAPTYSGVAYADILAAALATSSQYVAGTSNEIVQSGVVYPAETTTTFGATTTFDMTTFINTAVTLTGNITTMNVTGMAGKSGQIRFIQDATGSRTTVWNSIFKFSNGTTPTLTTTANAVDALEFTCTTSSYCVASLILNVK